MDFKYCSAIMFYIFVFPILQNNLLSKIIGLNDIIGKMFEIITPLPSIFLVLRVSYFLSGVEILERLGRASLYLCGNEFIIKELVPADSWYIQHFNNYKYYNSSIHILLFAIMSCRKIVNAI